MPVTELLMSHIQNNRIEYKKCTVGDLTSLPGSLGPVYPSSTTRTTNKKPREIVAPPTTAPTDSDGDGSSLHSYSKYSYSELYPSTRLVLEKSGLDPPLVRSSVVPSVTGFSGYC